MNRCHIVAVSPRTGTTLLAESMRSAFAIDAYEAHEARITTVRRDCSVYLTKYPGDLRAIQPRLRIDRKFYAVCLVRDPRDVIVSRHGRDLDHYWVSLHVWKERWPIARKLMQHDRFLIVRYEDLARDPDGTQTWLEERMPFLRRQHSFSAFDRIADPSEKSLEALGGVRPIDTSSIGSWKHDLPRIAGQLIRHGTITEQLVELGYEPDGSWESILDGVEPDFSPSHRGEGPRSRRLRRPRRGNSQIVGPWLSALTVRAARIVGVRLV
jgi:hypothetical protein